MYKLTQPVDSWKPVFDTQSTETHDDEVQNPTEGLSPVNQKVAPKYNFAYDPDAVEIEISTL